ncbi:prion-like-(Q/N-rich) domain-bearing protein 25 [Papilio machaon]|uniref:prion-like-(Q/N-rich) domain-bearing protein 25 n=1 Tax=Papilio machaon TaxID=76193 RepID=UPI001E6645F8|nr:prion-like-(Q/N-rich) domain-bearing protein 25 [Papilio machaon]
MESWIILSVIGLLLQSNVSAIWLCNEDSECASLAGSVCKEGSCLCPEGQQSVLGGTVCADLAPYYFSSCVEDHQCFRLFNNYECRRNENSTEGVCDCREGHHYLYGRCWKTSDFGETCSRNEECLGVIRNPFSMICDTTCVCADGYYLRQRGECRKRGLAVGDGCVVNEDCQFPDGACDVTSFTCYNLNGVKNTNTEALVLKLESDSSNNTTDVPEEDGGLVTCDADNRCPQPYECSPFGVCICPLGYYIEGNSTCLAELASPSTEEQCAGLLAVVVDGVCTCPPNFFFDRNMRDCIRVTRRFNESCVTDDNCHTFGAASRCGPPQEPWGLRTCECIAEYAVWDARREMCRLFAGIGETCEVDSDCLAGELEIQCVQNELGQGYCTCPDGLQEVDGLCLTTGLELGDSCQVTAECTGAEHAVCEAGRCVCGNGYQQDGNLCAPVIGGTCFLDTDCVIPDTICQSNNGSQTCQCRDRFVEYDDQCWPESLGHGSDCNVTAQCTSNLGEFSKCMDGQCECLNTYHYKDGRCWPMTGLFEACSRSSECYLANITNRVVCRNGLCQCGFDFPYSEQLNTCTSSGTRITVSFVTIAISLIYAIYS